MAIINIDMASYRSMFDGGQKACMFFINFSFPENDIIGGFMRNIPDMAKSFSTFGYGRDAMKYPYLVRTAQLPSVTYEEIVTKYNGLNFRQAGCREYADWTMTFNIDRKADILKIFNLWHDKIYDANKSVMLAPKGYMKDQEAYLLDGTGNTVLLYKIKNAWPKSVSEVELDYASSEIAAMTVTWSFTHFEIEQKSNNKEIDSIAKKLFNKMG